MIYIVCIVCIVCILWGKYTIVIQLVDYSAARTKVKYRLSRKEGKQTFEVKLESLTKVGKYESIITPR